MEDREKNSKKTEKKFLLFKEKFGRLSPCKMNISRFLPLPILTIVLSITFESRFGNKLMYQHAMKAPDEMRGLHRLFYLYTKNISCRKGRRFVQ